MTRCRSAPVAALFLLGLSAGAHGQGLSGPEKPVGILLAAGDIAHCRAARSEDEATARLIGEEIAKAEAADVPIRVLALGDLAYTRGTAEEFECFHDSWGRYKDHILPVPGNHEYRRKPAGDGAEGERHARPYFDYFSDNPFVTQNGGGSGYYSLNFPDEAEGPWRLIGLNAYVGIDDGSPQIAWLEDDLKRTRARCILAFAHPFVFSSGRHGHDNVDEPDAPLRRDTRMADAYRVLHEHGASVFLAGHDHDYEQFGRQDADGNAAAGGVRSFVVGTGGARLYDKVRYENREPNSEVYWQRSRGILKIELFPDRYRWDFVPIEGNEDIPLPVAEDLCNDRP